MLCVTELGLSSVSNMSSMSELSLLYFYISLFLALRYKTLDILDILDSRVPLPSFDFLRPQTQPAILPAFAIHEFFCVFVP